MRLFTISSTSRMVAAMMAPRTRPVMWWSPEQVWRAGGSRELRVDTGDRGDPVADGDDEDGGADLEVLARPGVVVVGTGGELDGAMVRLGRQVDLLAADAER